MAADSPRSGGQDLDRLQALLGHRFADLNRLRHALTHPSVAGVDRRGKDRAAGVQYERLEFLGDRVLGLVVAEWLLERFPGDREGDLAKRLAALVCRDSLCRVAEGLRLGDYLRLSPGEAISGGRNNRTILSDACEAVIGALYLDAGLEQARSFIRSRWQDLVERPGGPPRDSKTRLQEWVQANGKPLPAYGLVSQSGPAHDPRFEISVAVEGEALATGTGKSRRVAEQMAAAALLRRMGVMTDDDAPADRSA